MNTGKLLSFTLHPINWKNGYIKIKQTTQELTRMEIYLTTLYLIRL